MFECQFYSILYAKGEVIASLKEQLSSELNPDLNLTFSKTLQLTRIESPKILLSLNLSLGTQ